MSSKKNCGGKTHHTQVGFDKDRPCGDVPEVSPCLGKEVINLTVDIWDDPGCDGDNVVRIFNTGDCTYKDGYFYWSLSDLNVEMPPSSKWTTGVSMCRMLSPSTILNDCEGLELPDGFRVPSCADVQAIEAKLVKCGGDPIDGPLVQCDQIGNGLTVTSDGMVEVDVECGPGYMCLPNGCGTILWGYAVITADKTVHQIDLPVSLNAAVDPSQTSVTITDFGDATQVDGQLIDADDSPANLTSRQSSSNLSWTSMASNGDSSFGIYEVKSTDDALPSKTVTWQMTTNRTCA